MSAFLGTGAPVWEIRAAAGGPSDMLVRTPALGRSLADTLGAGPAALMRGHGAVVVGVSLPQVVARSIYLELNARLQLQAIQLGGDVTYLDPEEACRATAMMGSYERAWELWKRRVS
jgi:ribulose-5-phosphate 4-epimerase/fuculose-1-phosphate aldolase